MAINLKSWQSLLCLIISAKNSIHNTKIVENKGPFVLLQYFTSKTTKCIIIYNSIFSFFKHYFDPFCYRATKSIQIQRFENE